MKSFVFGYSNILKAVYLNNTKRLFYSQNFKYRYYFGCHYDNGARGIRIKKCLNVNPIFEQKYIKMIRHKNIPPSNNLLFVKHFL